MFLFENVEKFVSNKVNSKLKKIFNNKNLKNYIDDDKAVFSNLLIILGIFSKKTSIEVDEIVADINWLESAKSLLIISSLLLILL